MRGTAAMSVLALAGCAQVFGLDPTSAPPDAPPPTASLSFERLSIGATLERGPLDLSGETATFLVADMSATGGFQRVPATLAPGGSGWIAELPQDVVPSVEFTLPDQLIPSAKYARLWSLPSRMLRGLFSLHERKDPQPDPGGSVLEVRMTLPSGYASGQTLRIYGVGPWVQRNFAASELPAPDTGATSIGPVTIPYERTQFSGVGTNKPMLPRVTSSDRVVALRYVGSDLTAAGEFAPFDTTGATTPITATLVDVPHAPLDVALDPMAIASRLAMTTPQGSTLTLSWNVTAAPAYRNANTAGITLQAGTVALTDNQIATPYGNPFVGLGWNALFAWTSNRTRTYMVPSLMLPVTLYAGLNHFFEPAAGAMIDLPVGLPVLVSINQQPLTSDGLSVMLDPNRAVELSLVADRTANTYYQYAIHEVVAGAGATPTTAELSPIYAVLGLAPTLQIPPGVLQPGRIYTIRAHCLRGGFPDLASGDVQTRELPYSVGYLDSGVFTVSAP